MLNYQLNANVEGGMAKLERAYQAGGLPRLIAKVDMSEKHRHGSALFYLVLDANGKRLAGHLSVTPSQIGWSEMTYVEDEGDGDMGEVRVLLKSLGDGVRVAVGGDLEQVSDFEEAIFIGFLSAFGAVVALGVIGGLGLSLALLNRVETIRQTAEAIIAGDLSQRVPVRGVDDDLDRLSQTLNSMLDRISDLISSLRQVSADIAHDLKTPLTRLRRGLEEAQTQVQSPDKYNANIESAIVHVDEILATFSALLRIAQIEAGTRRIGFRDVDLSAIFATVAHAFEPAAEDAGKTLHCDISSNIRFWGDFELLTQMMANVVENAITHTPKGVNISVRLYCEDGAIVGVVSDDGFGVPSEEYERLFQRFYRLERSRSTPGNGLGLSLVKAVADLHSVELDVRGANPGLEVYMRFPV
jgi:signal transduction histidine kinase